MAWYDLIGSISELAERLKSYLWSWVDGIAKYWVQALGATKDYVQELYRAAIRYTDDWQKWLYNYINHVQDDLWKETALIWQRVGLIPVLTIDVIKGWVDPWINAAKSSAAELVNTAKSELQGIITSVTNRVTTAETWITEAPKWLLLQLEVQKEAVTGFIATNIELILDKVFKE